MVDPINTGISLAALAVSLATAWLTYWRRGTIRMSQPAEFISARTEGAMAFVPSDPRCSCEPCFSQPPSEAASSRVCTRPFTTMKSAKATWPPADVHKQRKEGHLLSEAAF
jgi:hypothetical protein